MWAAAGALALVGASQWLDTPRVEYLVVALLATAVSAFVAWRARPVARGWSMAATATTALALGLALVEQGALRAVDRQWPAFERRIAREAGAALDRRMREVEDELRRAATRAIEAPADPIEAFEWLGDLVDAPEERAVVLYRDGVPAAWAGRIRVLPGDLRSDAGLNVAASDFYLATYVVAQRGTTTAVAMALVQAVPPADRLATTVSGRIADDMLVRGFAFAPARGGATDANEAGGGTVTIGPPADPIFEATALVPDQGAMQLALVERARLRVGGALVLALAVFVVAAWRAGRTLTWRAGALAVALGCTAVAPLNQLSNLTRLFDSAVYFTPLGGPLTANAGALLVTGALVLLGILAVVRRQRGRIGRAAAVVLVVLVAGLGPFLLRDLARGIQIPPTGVDTGLWLIWEIPLFLAAMSVLLAGATAGSAALGRVRGLHPWVGPALAAAAALLAPVVWQAPAGWPWWYTIVWVGAIAALALARASNRGVLAAALVAAFGATTLVWANTARGRVFLAERELSQLERPDAEAAGLLERFARDVRRSPPSATRESLLQAFVSADLSAAEYPTALAIWDPATGDTTATLETGEFSVSHPVLRQHVQDAAAARAPLIRALPAWPGVQLALAVPTEAGVVTAVVAPRTSLIPPDPVARLLWADPDESAQPPYTIRLARAERGASTERWRRDGTTLRGIVPVQSAAGSARGLVDVELRPLAALMQRGVLLVLLDLAIVFTLWALTVVADGRFTRWLRTRRRRWRRSFRTQLSLALFLFFVIPAVAFAVWSYQQLLEDGRQTRVLLVRETLRATTVVDTGAAWIAEESRRLATPLLVYEAGLLRAASEPLYAALAPAGLLLRPDVAVALRRGDEVAVTEVEGAGAPLLFGYRAMDVAGGDEIVVAAPARTSDLVLDRRRQDLGILVLFATAAGALAALALSGLAARQLATPVGALRGAAMAIARGEREPMLEREPPVEFRPVFSAFRRMAADLNASRTALEAAQRRTAAVLRNVASGVVALGADGRVTLANPRAESLLGRALPPGTRLDAADASGVAAIAAAFIASGREEQDFDLEYRGVQLRGRATRLGADAAVVTLDDVTALARAQRVLAWGEMARQVAHEIKNPLTPIRLGVQHLRRARQNPRIDFDRVLDQNVTRILEEIDRLDEIARAFSKYGSAPEERTPAEPVDVTRVVQGIERLETMGEGDARFTVAGEDGPLLAYAQANELHEVLLNLVENARLAEAGDIRLVVEQSDDEVCITVRDDGHGIPADVLPRIFEPHFSTRTSGSGLGLAISRRLVEGWGGSVRVKTEEGKGTEVAVRLRRA